MSRGLRSSSLFSLSRRVVSSPATAAPATADFRLAAQRRISMGLAGAAALGAMVASTNAASCAPGASSSSKEDADHSKSSRGKSDPLAGGNDAGGDDAVEKLIQQYGPAMEQLGFGGFCGACAGYACKVVSRQVAVVIGIGFLSLQGLAYLGYVDVRWRKVRDDTAALLDADKDGKLTHKDFIILWKEFLKFATFNVPSVGGFAAGFSLGFYAA